MKFGYETFLWFSYIHFISSERERRGEDMSVLSQVVVVVLVLISGVCCCCGHLERLGHPSKADGSLSLLVVGDWGRRGLYNQSHVAFQMGIVGEKLDVDFIISTGDNFYDDGLRGVKDPAFYDSFTNIYRAPSLNKSWYSVLGNHDYRGDVEAQLSSVLRGKDHRWICFRSFILDTKIAEFFMVDTTPFVDKYFSQEEKDHKYDWTGLLPNRRTYLSNLLKELEVALKESTANWKIVVGHHTIKSAGHHGNTPELNSLLLPILLQNDVDLYINGHDHCLEHISSRSEEIEFITSGGGSKAWRGDVKKWDPNEMEFYYDGQGFISLQITPTQANIVFYDVFGNILHKSPRIKHQHSLL
ncbi:purple acid phosphatase 8-like [Euphorbia lathyris]|uniref:purple acid phosphatase 8-like n=1 Tax=Euphorbia lathyris TaxID=212925 RepID=UPI00331420C4